MVRACWTGWSWTAKAPRSVPVWALIRVFFFLLLSGVSGFTVTVLSLIELNHQDLKAETLAKATEFLYLGINGKQVRTKQKIQVRWLCPPPNWFKLNTDGTSLGNPGLAGGGGLIRNEKGDWVKGFARVIGTTTSVAAELWALRDGIRLCIALKLQVVVIELGSKLAVDLLKKELNNPNDIDVLVADCRNCLRNIPIVRIQHCYREGNKCVDALAGCFS